MLSRLTGIPVIRTSTGAVARSWRASLKPSPSTIDDCRRLYAFSPAQSQQPALDPDEHEFTDEELAEIDGFGIYSVILPLELTEPPKKVQLLRPVPPHIVRPPYIAGSSWLPKFGNGLSLGDARIALGTEAEVKLRRSAQLARDVLAFAGNLVRVSDYASPSVVVESNERSQG